MDRLSLSEIPATILWYHTVAFDLYRHITSAYEYVCGLLTSGPSPTELKNLEKNFFSLLLIPREWQKQKIPYRVCMKGIPILYLRVILWHSQIFCLNSKIKLSYHIPSHKNINILRNQQKYWQEIHHSEIRIMNLQTLKTIFFINDQHKKNFHLKPFKSREKKALSGNVLQETTLDDELKKKKRTLKIINIYFLLFFINWFSIHSRFMIHR